MDDEEKLEVMKIYSIAGLMNKNTKRHNPPFSQSTSQLICQSNYWRQQFTSWRNFSGASRFTFSWWMTEFSRDVLEALREPLEEGFINISRVIGSEILPARFTLIATMNPCPCGFYGDKEKPCSCTKRNIELYRKKISGPLLDRIDLCGNAKFWLARLFKRKRIFIKNLIIFKKLNNA